MISFGSIVLATGVVQSNVNQREAGKVLLDLW